MQTRAWLPLKDINITFTGFREEDAWLDDDNVEAEGAVDIADHVDDFSEKATVPRGPQSLEDYKQLALSLGARIDVTLLSSTDVLVARRGLTQKRLCAEQQGIVVVLPLWLEEVAARAHATEVAEPPEPAQLLLDSSAFHVPLLYGYVFTTTALTTVERVALEQICTQHGARMELSLTPFCDAVFTSASTMQQAKRLFDSATPPPSTLRPEEERSAIAAQAREEPLTYKIRAALQYEIPVMDYSKFMSLSRLAPTAALLSRIPRRRVGSFAQGLHSNGLGSGAAVLDPELLGRDYDTMVAASQLPVPDRSSAAWARYIAEEPEERSGDNLQPRQGGSDGEKVECSSDTSETSASWVMEADMWEDSAFCMDADDGEVIAVPATASLPLFFASALAPPLPLDTHCVEVHSTPIASTLPATAPDSYCSSTHPNEAQTLNAALKEKEEEEDEPQVDPSPRLTTNDVILPQRLVSSEAHPTNLQDQMVAYYAKRRTLPECRTGPAMAVGSTAAAAVETLVASCTSTAEHKDEGEEGEEGKRETYAAQREPSAQHGHPKGAAARSVSTLPRCPLWVTNPPFLTVALLGCSDAELQEAAVMCMTCRFLRSPMPTFQTDIVVLGSHLLKRRRYTAPTTASPQTRSTAPLRRSEPSSSGGAARWTPVVSIRYFECAADVAQSLNDHYGIAAHRLVPLVWLKDAQQAVLEAAAEQEKQDEEAEEQRQACLRCDPSSRLPRLPSSGQPCPSSSTRASPLDDEETTTTPTGTLADHLRRREEGLVEVRYEEHYQDAASSVVQSADGVTRGGFFPLPLLGPEELPDPSAPAYYIHYRRPITAALERQPPQQSENHETTVATQSAEAKSRHGTNQGNAGEAPTVIRTTLPSQTPHLPITKSDLLRPLKSTTAANDATAATLSDEGKEQVAYERDRAAATAQFQQLLVLLHGADGNAAVPSSSEEAELQRRHAQTLADCFVCCVENEYRRQDWAVARALVKYGGGKLLKQSIESWRAGVSKKKPGKSNTAATAEDQCFLKVVRQGIAYAKQRRVFLLSDCSAEATATTESIATKPSSARQRSRMTPSVLRATAEQCSRAPVLYLVPHSFQQEEAVSTTLVGVKRVSSLLSGAHGDASSSHGSGGFSWNDNTSKSAELMETLPYNSSTEDLRSTTSSRQQQQHPLRHLLSVTTDYILACLALTRCLDPCSCFLFTCPIPNPLVLRLHQQRHLRQAALPTAELSHQLEEGTAIEPSVMESRSTDGGLPVPSRWTRAKRYSKPDSVGVCVAFVWRLPVSAMATTPSGAPHEEDTSLQKQWAVSEGSDGAAAVPLPARWVAPLLRVLLHGFQNAVAALGGRVVEIYNAAAVTHLIVVDVVPILQSSLSNYYELSTTAVESDTPTTAATYWPKEELRVAVGHAATDEVSVVSQEWLASSVKWGIFVDEDQHTPPGDVAAALEASKAAILRRQHQQKLRRRAVALRGRGVLRPPTQHGARAVSSARSEVDRAATPERHMLQCTTARDVDDASTPQRHARESIPSFQQTPPLGAPVAFFTPPSRRLVDDRSISEAKSPAPSIALHHGVVTPPSAHRIALSPNPRDHTGAYAAHLGTLFNFMSPGSTPLPVRSDGQPSLAGATPPSQDSGANDERVPRVVGLPSQRQPGTEEGRSPAVRTSVASTPLSQHRRSLRGVAAAAAAALSASASPHHRSRGNQVHGDDTGDVARRQVPVILGIQTPLDVPPVEPSGATARRSNDVEVLGTSLNGESSEEDNGKGCEGVAPLRKRSRSSGNTATPSHPSAVARVEIQDGGEFLQVPKATPYKNRPSFSASGVAPTPGCAVEAELPTIEPTVSPFFVHTTTEDHRNLDDHTILLATPSFAGVKPRLGPCDATRQTSPVPQRPYGVVDVDMEPPQDPRQSLSPPPVDSGAAALSHVVVDPHLRPLSLSRRASHTPPAASAAVAEDKSPYQGGAACSPATAQLCIYVLHDVPHREERLHRCTAALVRLQHETSPSHTPAVTVSTDHLPLATSVANGPEASDGNARLHKEEKAAISTSGPIQLVGRCEKANVVVTHELTPRESVLIAIASGKWLVRPSFLELLAAVVGGKGGTQATTPALLSRLLGALPELEWSQALLPPTAPLIHIGLAVQCRQRRLRAQPSIDAVPTRIFDSYAFILVTTPDAAGSDGAVGSATPQLHSQEPLQRNRRNHHRHVEPLRRVIVAGGGHLCGVVTMGPSRSPGASSAVLPVLHCLSTMAMPLSLQLSGADSATDDLQSLKAVDVAHDFIWVMCVAIRSLEMGQLCLEQTRQQPRRQLVVLLDPALSAPEYTISDVLPVPSLDSSFQHSVRSSTGKSGAAGCHEAVSIVDGGDANDDQHPGLLEPAVPFCSMGQWLSAFLSPDHRAGVIDHPLTKSLSAWKKHLLMCCRIAMTVDSHPQQLPDYCDVPGLPSQEEVKTALDKLPHSTASDVHGQTEACCRSAEATSLVLQPSSSFQCHSFSWIGAMIAGLNEDEKKH